jgi:hypothetical protein
MPTDLPDTAERQSFEEAMAKAARTGRTRSVEKSQEDARDTSSSLCFEGPQSPASLG